MAASQPLTLQKVNDGVYRVMAGPEDQVGNLKLIGGQWKFKAVGHDAQGQVIPGGGPLTDRHNRVVAAPDDTVINDALARR